MFNDDDREEDAGFDFAEGGFSFAEFGKIEAIKTLDVLVALEKQLYDSPIEEHDVFSTTDDTTTQGYPMRFGTQGYDAHIERVDETELNQWKRMFPHMRALGVSLEREKVIENFDEKEYFIAAQDCDFPEYLGTNCIADSQDSRDLAINGKSIAIHPFIISEFFGKSDELDIRHGTMEEIIAIDNSNDEPSQFNTTPADGESFSPIDSKREEILSLAVDAIWPDIVECLMPLVQKIVRVSREVQLTYDPHSNMIPTAAKEPREAIVTMDGYDSW